MRQTLENQKLLHTKRSAKETVVIPKKFRILGAGRKVSHEALEESLYQWVIGRRNESRHVSRETIKEKAISMYNEFENAKPFNASNGWCDNFMRRFNLTTRQKTHCG